MEMYSPPPSAEGVVSPQFSTQPDTPTYNLENSKSHLTFVSMFCKQSITAYPLLTTLVLLILSQIFFSPTSSAIFSPQQVDSPAQFAYPTSPPFFSLGNRKFYPSPQENDHLEKISIMYLADNQPDTSYLT